MYSRTDFYLVGVIGFLVGLLVLIPASNLGIVITVPLALLSIVVFSVIAPCALAVLKLLSRWWKVFEQFGKFAAVGTLNTLLDVAVVSLLILFFHRDAGLWFSGFKAVSFMVATTNSYFWNKFWTFQSALPVSGGEYLRFALFTLGGLLLNVGVASVVRGFFPASPDTAAGMSIGVVVGVLAGVAVSFLWNFLSYKKIVFRNSKQTDL
jgi:putative flippase GtrA